MKSIVKSFRLSLLSRCSQSRLTSCQSFSTTIVKNGRSSPSFSTEVDSETEEEDGLQYGLNTAEKRKGLRRPLHSWETSVKYMDSETYKKTYGDHLIWKLYRRNTKQPFFVNPLPRHWCIKNGTFSTNWPCPICRDEYLVVDFRNTKLLSQFIIPSTGQLYPNHIVNVCQVEYNALLVETMKAKNRGYLVFDFPFRNYNYKEYYPWWNGPEEKPVPEEPEIYDLGREQPYVYYPPHNPEYHPLW